MDELLSIGEFSRQSGLSQKRLRSYAAAGLLIPAAVDSASGYRYYAPGQLPEAQLIDALREAGMPLADISAVLRAPSTARLDAWADHLQTDGVHRQAALRVARRLLSARDAPNRLACEVHARKETALRLTTGMRSDIGRVRDNNEDAGLVGERLVAVADGMGGAPSGEVAAAIAISLLDAAFSGESLDELRAGVAAANRAIWDRANSDVGLEGMGSTICAVGLTVAGRLAVVNVGDSRAYLFREGALTQLTRDHTVTAALVDRGELSEREALDHPHRNVLTRVLGGGPSVEADAATYRAVKGDRILVCSDGLFNELSTEELGEVLASTEDLQAGVDALIEAALLSGARDNVSAVLAEVCP